jgi:hypothetical protein
MDWRFWLRVMAALVSAAVVARAIWILEWFDVFRWGMPGPQQLAVYAFWTGAAAAAGWFMAALVSPRRPSN